MFSLTFSVGRSSHLLRQVNVKMSHGKHCVRPAFTYIEIKICLIISRSCLGKTNKTFRAKVWFGFGETSKQVTDIWGVEKDWCLLKLLFLNSYCTCNYSVDIYLKELISGDFKDCIMPESKRDLEQNDKNRNKQMKVKDSYSWKTADS